MISCYEEFLKALLEAGFSLASAGKHEAEFSLLKYNWDNTPDGYPIVWHTGDMETDPWEWRMRVLNERKDISYGKLFFNKAGFLTKQWAPFFLCARDATRSFVARYEDGMLSHMAKRIYEVVHANGKMALEEIKLEARITKEEKAPFDRALTELQMKMLLSMCGHAQKRNRTGEGYGWFSTVFCQSDVFFGETIMEQARALNKADAIDKIKNQVLKRNHNADEKKTIKFIVG